jgi:predicted amidohydrolase
VKVGYVQFSPRFGNKEENFKKVNSLINGVKAELLVLPELFATGYTFISKEEALSLAENRVGDTARFLQSVSKKTEAIIVGGFIEKDGNEIYNSSLIVNKEGVKGTYRKIHLYFKEKLWFSPGNQNLEVYQIESINIGIMICFDWMFPETMRTLALKGADIIAHPANLVMPYCQKAMVTRCLENRVYGITANRIGIENRGDDNFKFTGGSQITSYDGEILSSAPNNQDLVDIVEIDVQHARVKSLNEKNNLFGDRREDLYFK